MAEPLPPWAQTFAEFKQRVAEERREGKSPQSIADAIGISRAGLLKILTGETKEPYEGTQLEILHWLRGRSGSEVATVKEGQVEYQSQGPEHELLEFFLEHHPEMATFLSTSTEGLSAEDRRKVAVAIFNGFKKLAIQAGEQLPDWFFDLERKFVAR